MKHGKLFTTLLTFLGLSVSASAGTYTFSFNSLAEYSTASQIATYMDGVLTAGGCVGCSVTVTGAVADTTYSGEGNVVGPTTGVGQNRSTTSVTLGNTNGATSNSSNTPGSTDTFIANTNDSSSQISNEITITFHGLTLTSTSFDYEIFPDGSCPSLGYNNCGGAWNNPSKALSNNPNTPDFEFATGAGNTPVNAFGSNGNGIQYGVQPGGTDGSNLNSPDNTPEVAPQYIGVSGLLALPSSTTELDFIDWPATIGIDNLVINTPNTVPEPSSVFLLATAFLGAGLSLRRRFTKGV